MERYWSLGHRLPPFLARPLFGDRKRWGQEPDPNDPEWQRWRAVFNEYYYATQKSGIGARVNELGYRVMAQVELDGKTLLEIGPGEIEHIRYWRGRPAEMVLLDSDWAFIEASAEKLAAIGIPWRGVVSGSVEHRALTSGGPTIDMAVSFYSFEHIHPLRPLLEGIERMLKPGGLLVGAIPTEGGLAWGCGRFVTTRRYVHRTYGLDYDKLICWEHVNYAETILNLLGELFEPVRVSLLPFRLPSVDLNAVATFICRKR